MNSNPHNAMNADSGEETLRLIAGLPAPAGLEERVHKALRAAPRKGRVLAWPARFRAKTVMESNWMRAAAAAAIVFVVVGGGWGVYSRVQPGPAGKVIVMPQRMPSSGGFSGAGAIRTPQTIPGPKVREASHPNEHKPLVGGPGRDRGNKGPRNPSCEEACSGEEAATAPSIRRARPRRSRRFRGSPLRVLRHSPDQHTQQRQHHRAPEGRTQADVT
jgi:hypothetical protein